MLWRSNQQNHIPVHTQHELAAPDSAADLFERFGPRYFMPYAATLVNGGVCNEGEAIAAASQPVSLLEHMITRSNVDTYETGIFGRVALGFDEKNAQSLPCSAEEGKPIWKSVSGRRYDIEIDSSGIKSMTRGRKIDAVSLVNLEEADGDLARQLMAARTPEGRRNPHATMSRAILVLENDPTPGLHPKSRTDPDRFGHEGDFKVVDLITSNDPTDLVMYGQNIKLAVVGNSVVAEALPGKLLNDAGPDMEAKLLSQMRGNRNSLNKVIDAFIYEYGLEYSSIVSKGNENGQSVMEYPDLDKNEQVALTKLKTIFLQQTKYLNSEEKGNVYHSFKPLIRAFYKSLQNAKTLRDAVAVDQDNVAKRKKSKDEISTGKQIRSEAISSAERAQNRIRREVIEGLAAFDEYVSDVICAAKVKSQSQGKLDFDPLRYTGESMDEADWEILENMRLSKRAESRRVADLYSDVPHDTEFHFMATKGNGLALYFDKELGEPDVVTTSYSYNGNSMPHGGETGAFTGQKIDEFYDPEVEHFGIKGLMAIVGCAGPALPPSASRPLYYVDLLRSSGVMYLNLAARQLFDDDNQGVPENLYLSDLAYNPMPRPLMAVATHTEGDNSAHPLKLHTLLSPDTDNKIVYNRDGSVEVIPRGLAYEDTGINHSMQSRGRSKKNGNAYSMSPLGQAYPVETGRDKKSSYVAELGFIGLKDGTTYAGPPEDTENGGITVKTTVMRSERIPVGSHKLHTQRNGRGE